MILQKTLIRDIHCLISKRILMNDEKGGKKYFLNYCPIKKHAKELNAL